jgi:Fe-S-cluster containining protein
MDIKAIEAKIKDIYKEVDTAIGKFSSVCSKGCSHCCHQNITIVDVEGITISNYIDTMPSTLREQIKNNVMNWVKLFKANTPDRVLTEADVIEFEKVAATKRIACPFLINDACSIYEVRPITCRTHIVENSPEECNRNILRETIETAMKIKLETIKKLAKVTPFPTAFRILPLSLLEDLNIKVELRGIVMRAYTA